MSYTGINDVVIEKLRKVTDDQKDLDMIIDLLQKEKHYGRNVNQPTIKKEFQLLLEQHFPMDELQ